MNFELSEDQEMMRDTFARFLSEHSSTVRVRAAMPLGFDRDLWTGLAELGALSVRAPEDKGGLGLGLLDAAILMEEAGRTLASGPLAEALAAARLLAVLGGADDLLERALAGEAIVTLAFHDVAKRPLQWVAGGAVADAVIARDGEQVVLVTLTGADRKSEPNLASTPIAELDLKTTKRKQLSSGPEAVKAFGQALEEWKLLLAAGLCGLSREALKLAAAYASERVAFGQPIGAYQAISHPMADLITDIDGGKYFVWKAIRDIADGAPGAAAETSLAIWWNAETAGRVVAHALHTFGGYGLTTEYDIHLFNLRAKAWPLVFGDHHLFLEEAGRRLYAGETAALPDVGAVSIDFDLGDDARAFAQEVKDFFTKNLTPELRAKAHYSFDGHDAGVHKKLAEAGLLFPAWPKQYGGRGAGPYMMSAAGRVWEEENWTSHAVGTTSLVGAMMHRFGSEEVRRDILARISSGDAICSLGYSEPGSGSDVFAAKTKATQLPDGSWRIDGQKMFTSGANIADYVLLLTRTDPDAAKHKGLTMFIVPLKAPGVTIQPVYTFQDERTNITFYDGVIIPDSYRLGEVNQGAKTMAVGLELEHAVGSSDVQEALLHAAEEFCREIKQDNRALIDNPDAQKRLARTRAHVEISSVLGYRALWVVEQKKPNLAYGPMVKMFSTEKFLTDSRDLLELTAPYSLSKRDGPAGFLNQCYRHAHGTTIYAGTSEVHRSMIAERALGLPRSRG
jgi:alkylation response protein AidB-like acyl-CoA dehydrogenase